jgi:DNA polymerase-3 subunit delta'
VEPPSEASQSATELLRRSLARGRLGHAYLFQGDDLGALEQAAVDLARILSCTNPPESNPNGQPVRACLNCHACRRVENRTHPNVIWVHPESKMRLITADQAREVTRVLNMRPFEAGRKVAVFIGADRLHPGAANAFLKTLEEPPAGSVILLLSTEPGRVLDTLVSRCLRLSFGSAGLRLETEVRAWVAGFAAAARPPGEGLMARYRLLGQLLQALANRRTQIESTLADDSPLAHNPDASPDQREQWDKELSSAIESEYRRIRADFLAGLHAWLRDIWLIRAGVPESLFLPELEPASREIAGRLTPEDARANLDAWEITQRLLHTNVQEALALEVGLLKLHL